MLKRPIGDERKKKDRKKPLFNDRDQLCNGLRFAAFLFVLFWGCSVVHEPTNMDRAFEDQYPVSFIPIALSPFQIPFLDIEIEGKSFPAKLDLGFCGSLAMTKEGMDLLSSKKFLGEKSMYGMRGKEYKKRVYHIPKVNIGTHTFPCSVAQEEDADFLKDATLLQNEMYTAPKEVTRLGWELFRGTRLLIDIPNSRVGFYESLNDLQKSGYSLEKLLKVPLLLDRGLVEFEAVASNDPVRCVLDTGTTWNILNREDLALDDTIWEEKNVVKQSLKIQENDFGLMNFHQIPIRIPVRIEAILGMEFFKNHLVLLDFEENFVYFQAPF